MKRHFIYYFSLFIILAITNSCITSSRIYTNNNKNKSYPGQLDDATFKELKKYLTIATNSTLKDTIIIKYDYNNETCWNALDQKEETVINYFIAKSNESVEKAQASKINTSIFIFREPGAAINKIKKWDDKIIIDSGKKLLNLLFKERTTCGTSIIILPNKAFILLRSDAHFEALDYDKTKIEAVLIK